MQRLIYVPMVAVAPQVDILVVGDAPGEADERMGQSLVGRPGRLLRDALLTAGADFDRIALTNVIKVRPQADRTPTEDEIYSWLPSLWADIVDTTPLAIVALGRVAHRAVRLYADRLTDVELHFLPHPKDILRRPEKEIDWRETVANIVQAHCLKGDVE